MNLYPLLIACLIAAVAPALAQHAPHVHGAAELRVAIDNKTLSIELEGPLENLLGFEHAPKTPDQHAAVKSMMAKLNNPAALFKLPPAAGCTASPVRIHSPVTDAQAAPSKAAKAKPKDADGDHAEISANFEFVCAQVEKLNAVEIGIFQAFPGTKRITAEIMGPRGQSGATLTPSSRKIKF